MDPKTQQSILDAVRQYGRENVIVVLGSPNAEAAAIAAETVVSGDPTFAGPLAETQLGLPVFHILDERVRQALDPQIYDQQVGLMADVLDGEAIVTAVEQMRNGSASGSSIS